MNRIIIIILGLMLSLGTVAQNADQLYKEGKALYDAKNYEQALPKLKAAAAKGHKKAQYRLGRCYDKGHAVAEDNAMAVQWYAKSAAQGYAKAEYQMGKAYLKGKGVAADEAKARTWLRKAVKNDKSGTEILNMIKADASDGDEDARKMLNLIGKKQQ